MGNNAKLLIGTLVGTFLLILGVSVFFSSGNTAQVGQPVDQNTLLEGATHFKGAENPEVTIVEFSDFECPACASVAPALRSIVESYPEVQMVYRHFPLMSIHRNALAAGRASEAAHQQGKFWEMHDALFASQLEWTGVGNPDDFFLDLARQIGLDEAAYQTAYNSTEVRDLVMADLRLAEKLKLGSTPTLFYNGEMMDISEVALRLAEDFPDTTQQLFDEAEQEASAASGIVESESSAAGSPSSNAPATE